MRALQLLPMLGLAVACLAAPIAAHANPATTTVSLDGNSGSWLAIAPVGQGDQQYVGINNAGIAFQNANIGWNNSLAYDASAWVPYAPYYYGSGWVPADGLVNPFFMRDVFTVGASPTATFSVTVDDDSQVWVNGILAHDDHDNNSNGPLAVNITPDLVVGQNLIAVKVYNAQGDYYANVLGSVTSNAAVVAAPEPASIAVLGIGISALLGARRRRN